MKKYKVELTDFAEEEFISSYNYYENQLTGLGAKFTTEIDSVLSSISSNPFLFPRRYKFYREALVSKFPFFIIYEVIETTVVVHSLFHTSKNPGIKLKTKRGSK